MTLRVVDEGGEYEQRVVLGQLKLDDIRLELCAKKIKSKGQNREAFRMALPQSTTSNDGDVVLGELRIAESRGRAR